MFSIICQSTAICARFETPDSTKIANNDYHYNSDTSRFKKPLDENPIANLSLIASILSPVTFFLAAKDIYSNFGVVILAGFFGLSAFIAGIVGLKRRKKIIAAKYTNRADSDILPLGYTKSYLGIIVGAVVSITTIITVIAMALAF